MNTKPKTTPHDTTVGARAPQHPATPAPGVATPQHPDTEGVKEKLQQKINADKAARLAAYEQERVIIYQSLDLVQSLSPDDSDAIPLHSLVANAMGMYPRTICPLVIKYLLDACKSADTDNPQILDAISHAEPQLRTLHNLYHPDSPDRDGEEQAVSTRDHQLSVSLDSLVSLFSLLESASLLPDRLKFVESLLINVRTINERFRLFFGSSLNS